MDKPVLLSAERLNKLDRWCQLADDRAIGVDPDELRSLIAAARLAPVLMAECEAWRQYDEIRHSKHAQIAGECLRYARETQAATDAALARAGKGEKR